MQSDLFNRSRIGTTVVCVITSNVSRAGAPGNVLLADGEANLPKTSVVNVSQIVTVDKEALADYLGKLRPTALRAVEAGLALLFRGTQTGTGLY